ncbi:MAG: heme NO-binding domain-containing protein [Acetobacteraceae bacterium]
MKGIIFNLLEEVVSGGHREAVWDEILDRANLEGVYTTLGNYPHAELEQLMEGASTILEMPRQDMLRWYGRRAMPLLAERFPTFFDRHTRTRDFLMTLNGIIHPEVMKLYPGTRCPHFEMRTESDGALMMRYASPRQFCRLAHGFIEGAADHYGETISVAHLACMHEGDTACLIRVSTA